MTLTSDLLGASDRAPFEIVNAESTLPWLIVCDHADRVVPTSLGDLGLPRAAFDQHVAYDIGALFAAQHLAQMTGACLIHTRYSRLVIDVNRAIEDPGQIPAISDGIIIPANQGLTEKQRKQRQETLFTPYHQAIAARLDIIAARGQTPALISIHSFTPMINDFQRPWDIGFVWEHDSRLVIPVMDKLQKQGWRVGDNEPYSGHGFPRGYTNNFHAERLGRANLLVEFRQDLIANTADAIKWANQLADPLLPLLTDPGLYTPWQKLSAG
jgi:predicted N-formylglutamate amidohydrolase